MHHQIAGRKFSRHSAHRLAMIRNLAKSLVKHNQILTTHEKAKELQKFIEPLITLACKKTLASRRLVQARIGSEKIVIEKIIKDLVPCFDARPGGYTRVLKAGYRKGDGAKMAYIQWTQLPQTDISKVLDKKSDQSTSSNESTQSAFKNSDSKQADLLVDAEIVTDEPTDK